MSIAVQKQIKDNSTQVSDFFSDLVRWEEEQSKEEKRRETRKAVEAGRAPPVLSQPPASSSTATTKGASNEKQAAEPKAAIKRDKLKMANYYNSWESYSAEAEVEKLEDEAFEQQKAERDARQAEKDHILDEMALQPDGDRKRTSTARPRVKVSVRTSGRRPAPVDFAKPKKEVANRYFQEGRFREAIATYTAALDCLEKYEPPKRDQAVEAGATKDEDTKQQGDCAGQESEALELKVALLANRALACYKLEEWREAAEDCTEAIRFEPSHHKAILRRGFAFARMKRWAAASRDLERAVATDPKDAKAAAELQMARRMLAQQCKDARASAQNAICDPTRALSMPLRKLAVKVKRAGASTEAEDDAPRPAPGSSTAVLQGEPDAAPRQHSVRPEVAVADGAGSVRQPYVPRSVRLRGSRQPTAAQSEPRGMKTGSSDGMGGDAPSTSTTAPGTMSFYTFEAAWARHRGSSADRAALLRRVGARALPALFRESLDSELVASIVEVLSAEVSSGKAIGADDTKKDDVACFATAVLQALLRTQRFELSLQGLSAGERRACCDVIDLIASYGSCNPDDVCELRRAFELPSQKGPSSDEQQTGAETFSLDDCD